MNRYSHASSLFYGVPLALLPSKAHEIHDFWTSKLAGGSIEWEDRTQPFAVRYFAERRADDGEIDELDLFGADAEPQAQRSGAVAVIPIYGTISQRMNMMSAMSGGTSTQQLTQAFRKAMNDAEVSAIVFDIDSPGGSSYGVAELASEILAARGRKPMLSVANSVEASAAYWLGSMADYNYATPGALVGSVGVYAMHQDYSAMLANEGVKTTFIQAGKNKTRANPYEPLSQDDAKYLQELVDDTYSQFVAAVAAGRRTSVARVKADYGEGDVLTPKAAEAVGMIDGIKTLDEVIAIALKSRTRKPGGQRAAEIIHGVGRVAGTQMRPGVVVMEDDDSTGDEPESDPEIVGNEEQEQEREAGRKRLARMRLLELQAAS